MNSEEMFQFKITLLLEIEFTAMFKNQFEMKMQHLRKVFQLI